MGGWTKKEEGEEGKKGQREENAKEEETVEGSGRRTKRRSK